MSASGPSVKGRVDIDVDSNRFIPPLQKMQQELTKFGGEIKRTQTPIKNLGSDIQGATTKLNTHMSVMSRGAKSYYDTSRSIQQHTQALTQMTQKMGQVPPPVQRISQTAKQATQSVQQLGQRGQQSMNQFAQSANNAAGSTQRMQGSMAGATQATGRLNAGTIGTAASIGTMGAGLVSLEASMSNYTKATFKVEKAELKVLESRKLLDYANNMVQKKELQIRKARELGNKTAEEMQIMEGELSYYRQDAEQKTEKMRLAQEKLNIANMDYADTQKLMASSIATTLLGTISAAAQMMSGYGNSTAGATAKTKLMTAAEKIKSALMLKSTSTTAAAAASNKALGASGLVGMTGLKAMAGGIKAITIAMATNPIGAVAIGVTAVAAALGGAWMTNFMGFRDSIHWLLDAMQKAYMAMEKILFPLKLLREGLQSLGIDIGGNIDKWQEYEQEERRLQKAMEDGIITQSEYDDQLQRLNVSHGRVADAARELTAEEKQMRIEMGLTADKAEELDHAAGQLTDTVGGMIPVVHDASGEIEGIANTMDVMATPAAGRFHDAMHGLGVAISDTAGDGIPASFRMMSDGVYESVMNADRIIADHRETIRHFGNRHREILAERGPEAAAIYASEMRTHLESSADNIRRYGGSIDDVFDLTNGAFSSLGETASSVTSSVADDVHGMAASMQSDMSGVREATENLKKALADLKKNHFEPGFSYMSSSLDTLREGLRQLHLGQAAAAEFARSRGLPAPGQTGTTETGGGMYHMAPGESALNPDGTINFDKLMEIQRKVAGAKAKKAKVEGGGAAGAIAAHQAYYKTIQGGPDPDHDYQQGASDRRRGVEYRNQRDFARAKGNSATIAKWRDKAALMSPIFDGMAIPTAERTGLRGPLSPGRGGAGVNAWAALVEKRWNEVEALLAYIGWGLPDIISDQPTKVHTGWGVEMRQVRYRSNVSLRTRNTRVKFKTYTNMRAIDPKKWENAERERDAKKERMYGQIRDALGRVGRTIENARWLGVGYDMVRDAGVTLTDMHAHAVTLAKGGNVAGIGRAAHYGWNAMAKGLGKEHVMDVVSDMMYVMGDTEQYRKYASQIIAQMNRYLAQKAQREQRQRQQRTDLAASWTADPLGARERMAREGIGAGRLFDIFYSDDHRLSDRERMVLDIATAGSGMNIRRGDVTYKSPAAAANNDQQVITEAIAT